MTDTPAHGAEPGAPVSASPAQARRQNGIGTATLVVGVVALVLAVLFIFAPLGACSA
jgi:hypothetical protein